MKQHDAGGKNEQRSMTEESDELGRRPFSAPRRDTAMRPFRIDLDRGYAPNGEERGNEQKRRDDKNGARREEVAARAHRSGGKTVADRREAGISSKTFCYGLVSHKPEADGGDRRSEHAARRGMQA